MYDPLVQSQQPGVAVETFRFLEFTVSQDLNCASNIIIKSIIVKGPAEDACPAPAQEVQPASGASDPVLPCNNPVRAHPSMSGLDRPPNKTGRRLQRTTGLQQKNNWCQPALRSGTFMHTYVHQTSMQRSIRQTTWHKTSACCMKSK